MQWREWRKIASLWRFELDARSGPLEAGNFGKIDDFGENRQRADNNGDKEVYLHYRQPSGDFR